MAFPACRSTFVQRSFGQRPSRATGETGAETRSERAARDRDRPGITPPDRPAPDDLGRRPHPRAPRAVGERAAGVDARARPACRAASGPSSASAAARLSLEYDVARRPVVRHLAVRRPRARHRAAARARSASRSRSDANLARGLRGLPAGHLRPGRRGSLDMDTNHVEASINYPNTFPRFAGQGFAERADKELALASLQIYNDWMIDEWCGGDGRGRLIPLTLVPLWDAELAAAEVRRCAAKGSYAIAFTENPAKLGFPSLYTGKWDPLWEACTESDTVVSMHIGSSSTMPTTSDDAPLATSMALNSQNAQGSRVRLGVLAHARALPQHQARVRREPDRVAAVPARAHGRRLARGRRRHRPAGPAEQLRPGARAGAASSTTSTGCAAATRSASSRSCSRPTIRTPTARGPTLARGRAPPVPRGAAWMPSECCAVPARQRDRLLRPRTLRDRRAGRCTSAAVAGRGPTELDLPMSGCSRASLRLNLLGHARARRHHRRRGDRLRRLRRARRAPALTRRTAARRPDVRAARAQHRRDDAHPRPARSAGWVTRAPDPDDRRRVVVDLVGEGLRARRGGQPELHAWEDALALGLTTARRNGRDGRPTSSRCSSRVGVDALN